VWHDLQHVQDNLYYFPKVIITGNETRVYGYDPEIKQQLSQRKYPQLPRPNTARQV
jgi:hypothetical protein